MRVSESKVSDSWAKLTVVHQDRTLVFFAPTAEQARSKWYAYQRQRVFGFQSGEQR